MNDVNPKVLAGLKAAAAQQKVFAGATALVSLVTEGLKAFTATVSPAAPLVALRSDAEIHAEAITVLAQLVAEGANEILAEARTVVTTHDSRQMTGD